MKTKYISIFIMLLALVIQFGCEPEYKELASYTAPNESQLSFTVTPGSTAFEVLVENTSNVEGIVKWDFGNGTALSGNSGKTNYRIEGTYTITMSIFTKGGSASIKKDYQQTTTDYTMFSDPMFIALSGGANAVQGKTWQLDSLSRGHLGVGPADGDALTWWAANPLAKKGAAINMYDDEINFKINEFKATLINNGKSYVKGYVKDATGFSNPVENDVDFTVNYTPPTNGKWNIVDLNGKKYLQLTGSTPMFPCFYVGPADGLYEIKTLTENLMVLNAIDGVEGNKWNFQLIPKGYVKPKLEYDLSVTATANPNEFSIGLTNISLPAGWSISNITYKFGDGAETTTTNTSVLHAYMRKGTYTINVMVTANSETFDKSHTVVLANNHPTYVEYLLDAMVMYNDFGETTIMPVGGQDCSVSIVANPNKSIWPNRSNNCALYSKTNQQWANANMQLPTGYRFDIRQQSTFKLLVYGKKDMVVLLKLENTDKGGDAWQTGTELTYTIKANDKWEIATFNFDGADVMPGSEGWKWWPDPVSYDVKADNYYNHDFYNIIRIMLNPGVGSGTHTFHFDDLAGPHVEGLKK
jgi:hypothetical protein